MTAEIDADTAADDVHDDIIYPSAIPFVLVHLGCFAAIWTGVTLEALALCITLYWLRIFAIGAGYHRYFSHRSYSTSRAFQFVLAFCPRPPRKRASSGGPPSTAITICIPTPGTTCIRRGTRFHLQPFGVDLLPEARRARFRRSLGSDALSRTDVAAQIRAPSGRAPCRPVLSPGGLVRPRRRLPVEHGARLSRHLLHQLARPCERQQALRDGRRFAQQLAPGDRHHGRRLAQQSPRLSGSVRQGFKWWEIDPTYYLLRALSWTGLVWDLKTPPEPVLRNEQRLGAKVINRAAEELAARFNSERIAAAIAAALHTPEFSALRRP